MKLSSEPKRRYAWLLNPANALFIVTFCVALFPGRRAGVNNSALVWLIALIGLGVTGLNLGRPERQKIQTRSDVTAIVYCFLLVWESVTAKLNLLDKSLYPAPGEVLQLLLHDLPELLKGLVSSLQLLAGGYLTALVTAIPLALLLGWRGRLYRAAHPFTKILGPIPTTVYIPYAIAILPTFRAASIFVIWVGAFWPIFMNTLNGVFNIEKKMIDSAKALNVSERTMLFRVILPGALPAIFGGVNIGLVFSFILLTSAELIGSTSGIGWYVKYYSDFADYHRVIVGIVFIGAVVTLVTFFVDRLEKYWLRWRN